MPMRLFCARPPIWRVLNSCAPRVDASSIDRPHRARESLGPHAKMESALLATTRARMVLLVGIGKASMRMGSASRWTVGTLALAASAGDRTDPDPRDAAWGHQQKTPFAGQPGCV